MRTVLALKKIGVMIDLKDRIKPMVVMQLMARFWRHPSSGNADNRSLAIEIEECLAELVRLRTEGLEPLHDGLKYIQ